MNRQQERSSRSSEALLDAAAELVAAGGLASMTVGAVSERAGYSRGLVSARFGTKAGLVDALIGRVWRRLEAAGVVPMSRKSPAISSLTALVDGLAHVADSAPGDLRALAALVHQASGADDELRDRMTAFADAMRSELADALERGIADGSVRADVDPGRDSVVLVAALNGIAYQWLLDADGIDAADSYSTMRDVIEHRYTPR